MIIDVHSHVLPGVDDGAQDWNTSMQMLVQSSKQGVQKVIATPHYYPWRTNAATDEIRRLCKEAKERLCEEHGIDMEIYPGQEILYGMGVLDDLKAGKILTLADSRYVLIEFMPDETFSVLYHAVRELMSAGYIPILAHVERYDCLRQMDNVNDLKEGGALFQMNASAVCGGILSQKSRWSKKMLKAELIDYIASDMHNLTSRGPHTEEKIELIRKVVESEYLKKLLYKNCEKIIKNV